MVTQTQKSTESTQLNLHHFIWEEKGQRITCENSRSRTTPLNQMIQYQMCHNKIIQGKTGKL